jgi:ferric-dicitrate binding protein FerR (iron transport regulator)
MYHDKNERIWHLLARKTAKEISAEEIKELERLLQQYPYALYMQELMNQEWRDTYKSFNTGDITLLVEKHKQRLHAAQQSNEVISMKSTAAKPIPRILLRFATIAASVLLLAFAGWKWGIGHSEKDPAPLLQHLATQMGSRSEVLLPDGTKVRLNAGSSLDYPKQFNGKTREVKLIGEAYFDVAKDSAKPFFVHTKAFTIKVTGTVFNVRAYSDEDSAVASLIHGSVEVQFDKNKDNIIMLRPNEKLTVAMPAVRPDENKNAIPENHSKEEKIYVKRGAITTMNDSTIAETAWVQNKLAFKNISFEKIAASLEKWFGADIRFKTEGKKLLNLTGTFEGESLEEVLRAFQLTGTHFRYSKDSEGVIWIE